MNDGIQKPDSFSRGLYTAISNSSDRYGQSNASVLLTSIAECAYAFQFFGLLYRLAQENEQCLLPMISETMLLKAHYSRGRRR
jgi:hypothetical protein